MVVDLWLVARISNIRSYVEKDFAEEIGFRLVQRLNHTWV
jgi:hypothetical protein